MKNVTKKVFTEVAISNWQEISNVYISSLTVECFCLSLNLVYGKLQDFKNYVKKQHEELVNIDECTAVFVSLKKEGVTWYYILIQENDWYAQDYGIICHELHHFIHKSLEEKGVTYAENSEEVYAYLQGHFMELVIKSLLELKKVIDKNEENTTSKKNTVKGKNGSKK